MANLERDFHDAGLYRSAARGPSAACQDPAPPMPSPLPILRAPPFPGIRAHVATVSMLRDPAEKPIRRDEAAGEALIAAMREARVGGAFWAPAPPDVPGALVVLRPESAADGVAMVEEALREADAAQVLALLPRTRWASGARRALDRMGVTSVVGEVDPWPMLRAETLLLAHGDDEYLLLAQVAGARVRVRSSGRFAPADARRTPTLADRVHAELVAATAYRDPLADRPADAVATVALLGEWRRTIDSNRGIAVATGMARWKRREIERFLWSGRAVPMRFVRKTGPAVALARKSGSGIAVWPSRAPRGLAAAVAAARVPVISVEDGFIRSVGLGAACIPPLSIAVDRQGLHYDPSAPSDLETLLATTPFSANLCARAERLLRFIVDHGIGKYAVGRDAPAPPRSPDGRRRILVPGQVEDDLSVRLGGAGLARNLDLLARVRETEPDAEIWYRPHPDVDAGLRLGAIPDADALAHADRIARKETMATLLDQVDGVHVLTSLTGFEALLRGLDVTVHGQPFYAGWGLTRDLAPPIARRGRRLTLNELVAGVLILYPRYLDPATGLPCPPERMMEQLASRQSSRSSLLTHFRRLQGRLRRPVAKRVSA